MRLYLHDLDPIIDAHYQTSPGYCSGGVARAKQQNPMTFDLGEDSNGTTVRAQALK